MIATPRPSFAHYHPLGRFVTRRAVSAFFNQHPCRIEVVSEEDGIEIGYWQFGKLEIGLLFKSGMLEPDSEQSDSAEKRCECTQATQLIGREPDGHQYHDIVSGHRVSLYWWDYDDQFTLQLRESDLQPMSVIFHESKKSCDDMHSASSRFE